MTETGSEERDVAERTPRWWLRILVVIATLAVLVGGAELALRAIIPSVIATAVRDNMGLANDHPVEVELAGSALLPALSGRVENVSLTVPDVEVFEGISTRVHAHADSLPFDPTSGRIEGATVSATIPSSSLGPLMEFVTDGFVNEGEVKHDELLLGRTMQLFGYDVHLTAGLKVSVDAGALLIEPTSVQAAGFDLTAEQLRPMLGDAAATLLDPHTLCVKDRLPVGITLTDVQLRSTAFRGSVTVSADLDPELLSNPATQQLGECEPE